MVSCLVASASVAEHGQNRLPLVVVAGTNLSSQRTTLPKAGAVVPVAFPVGCSYTPLPLKNIPARAARAAAS